MNKQETPSSKRRGVSVVPFFGDLLAMTRLVRDREAHLGLKIVSVLAILYVVLPIDAVPEAVLPVVGWIDDVGLIVALRMMLDRPLGRYRYPLFEKPARAEGRSAQFASG